MRESFGKKHAQIKTFEPSDMVKGWYIGNFEPTAYKTSLFEVAIIEHKAGEFWPTHYHAEADEINYLLEGEMILNEKLLKSPIIFVISKNEIVSPTFITDCRLVVVKTPSIPGDKYIIPKDTI